MYFLFSEKEKSFVPHRRSPSPENSRGITIAAAKYSSEDAATLVNYTIAIVEYTRLCGPLKTAIERMHELEREIEENARIQKEKEQAVSYLKLLFQSFLFDHKIGHIMCIIVGIIHIVV